MRQIAKALILLAALLGLLPVIASAQAPEKGKSRVLCYTAYDSDFFYLAAVVQKPALVGRNSKFFSKPLEDDSIAVFLQIEEGDPGVTRTSKSVEMAVSVAGGGQLYRGAAATPLNDFPDFLKASDGSPKPFKYAVKANGTVNGAPVDSNSYTVEMAIPWIELGGPPTIGQRLRFNVVALSAAPSTAPLLSLSPGVKTPADLNNPSLWSEIVFVDAPVKTVASAPQAKVSARLFSAKPLIDGQVDEAVWSTLTAFGFSETANGAVELTPNAAVSRVRPKVNLKKARPFIKPVNTGAAALAAHVAQTVPRLVFTLYHYEFQNDTRKSAPLTSTRTPNGASLISTHPMEGSGPWMTYDRVDWHYKQLDNIRKSGIDVILPIYRASVFDKQRYSQRGLITLVGALNHMKAIGSDYPLVGLYLDTTSITDSLGNKPDLKSPEAQAKLYIAIKDFYLQIPARYQAAVPLDPKNGGGKASIVVLSSGVAFADMDASFVDYCRAHFKADFGNDLLILGSSDFKDKVKLDGYVNDTHGQSFQMDEAGWIKPASFGVGFDDSLHNPTAKEAIRSRLEGDTYRKEWKQALAKKPDWVFLDGWNDFEQGAEIAPSMQNGIQYSDLTMTYTRAFAGAGAVMMRASYLSDTIPNKALAGSTYSIAVRVQNAGTGLWPGEGYAVICRWQKADGSPVGTSVTAPITRPVIPGQAITVPLAIQAPSEPGSYSLAVDMAQVGKKGDVTALFSSLGSIKREARVQVLKTDDPSLPSYDLRVIAHDLPTTVEAGGTYTAHITLRNDGAKPWKKSEGGRILARVWRYTSAINGTGETENIEPIDMADAGADLPADIAPGQEVTVAVPITFSQADGAILRSWSQSDNWTYQLRWEYSANEGGSMGAVSGPEPLALVDADFGPRFIADLTPNQLPGERRIPVKLGVQNLGPQTWIKDKARIGYHWYYLDGTEAVWQDETTPIPQDIEPGGEVTEMLTWVTAPPNDGSYWLVWDLKMGDTWASTLPSVRANETHVHQIEVVHGRSHLVDLTKAYNQDAVSHATDPKDGDFDGSGRSLPAELVPPFALTDAAPSTIWLPTPSVGQDSPRRISFKWGPKGDKENNLIQCVGQRVSMGDPKKLENIKTVHLLAASTKAGVTGAFTLVFSDTSQQLTSFPLSRWDQPPTHGEEVAFYSRYSRTRSGDAMDKPVALYHYTIRVPESKKLLAIIMPDSPEIKIAAITLEK
jgi:hypothetical protein